MLDLSVWCGLWQIQANEKNNEDFKIQKISSVSQLIINSQQCRLTL